MASKNVVADLTKGEKLDGTNYDMWHRKIRYLLNEQEVLETLTTSMVEPEKGDTAQHRRDIEAYQAWVKKDRCARFTMLSSMHNDLIGEFESSITARDMWDQLKVTYGTTSATRLRALTLKFEQYTADPKHSMPEHLRAMSAMIRDLKAAGNVLTDEQQVPAVIRSLPESWGQMKLVLTHSENIKTFVDISRHLELEAERLGAHRGTLFVAQEGQRQPSGSKRKGQGNSAETSGNHGSKKEKGNVGKRRRGKRGGKKDKSKIKCYNCQKMGHFANECTEAKKEQPDM